MRICQIGVIEFKSDQGIVSKAVGGISGYIYELVNGLIDRNISVTFIGKIYNYKSLKGLDYFEIQKELSSTNKFLLNLFFKSFFIRLEKNTIVHAHRPDNLAAFMFFRRAPAVLTIHGQQAITVYKRKNFLIRTIYTLLEKSAIRKANYIITTDNITKEYYATHYQQHQHKMLIMPTGVNFDDFKPLSKDICRTKYNLNKFIKIILYIGRIEAPKKVADIVKAYEIIYKNDPDTLLMLIGDGQQLIEIKSLVKELDLEKVVLFYGARLRQDLPELINCADITVLYSGNEGSPLSVKESLACGIPVVSNKVGDVDTVIQSGKNGFLVEDDNIDSLAFYMKECLSNAQLMKNECLKSCEKYSITRINKEIINLYKKL